jgi:hypothetical protein
MIIIYEIKKNYIYKKKYIINSTENLYNIITIIYVYINMSV